MKVSGKTSDCDRKMPELIAACIHQLTIGRLTILSESTLSAPGKGEQFASYCSTSDADGLDGVNGVDDREYLARVGGEG